MYVLATNYSTEAGSGNLITDFPYTAHVYVVLDKWSLDMWGSMYCISKTVTLLLNVNFFSIFTSWWLRQHHYRLLTAGISFRYWWKSRGCWNTCKRDEMFQYHANWAHGISYSSEPHKSLNSTYKLLYQSKLCTIVIVQWLCNTMKPVRPAPHMLEKLPIFICCNSSKSYLFCLLAAYFAHYCSRFSSG